MLGNLGSKYVCDELGQSRPQLGHHPIRKVICRKFLFKFQLSPVDPFHTLNIGKENPGWKL